MVKRLQFENKNHKGREGKHIVHKISVFTSLGSKLDYEIIGIQNKKKWNYNYLYKIYQSLLLERNIFFQYEAQNCISYIQKYILGDNALKLGFPTNTEIVSMGNCGRLSNEPKKTFTSKSLEPLIIALYDKRVKYYPYMAKLLN